MKCWKCGAELAPGAAFCSFCGAAQEQASWNEQEPLRYQTPPSGGPDKNAAAILTIFSAVCAMVYGGQALRPLLSAVFNLFYHLTAPHGFHVYSLITICFDLLYGILGLFMCALLVMTALRRTPQNSDGLLVCMGCVGAALAAARLVNWVFVVISMRAGLLSYTGQFFKTLLGAVFVAGGVYAIERFLLGESPLMGKSADDLKEDALNCFNDLGQAACEAGAQASQAAANAKAEREARAAQYAQYGQRPPAGFCSFYLKTDRSLIAYILLTIITCGFYSWYFIYALARDVNIACAGDGKTTPGFVKLVLLSLVTCGFYSFYWYYSLGNRLADNAPRYGMRFQENGTTVLLWYLVGMLACGLGPFVAMHIIIKNTNSLCSAYNCQQGA